MSTVDDNPAERRFELAIEGSQDIAAAYYRLEGERLTLTHTIVPERYSGQGVGSWREASSSCSEQAAARRSSAARSWQPITRAIPTMKMS